MLSLITVGQGRQSLSQALGMVPNIGYKKIVGSPAHRYTALHTRQTQDFSGSYWFRNQGGDTYETAERQRC